MVKMIDLLAEEIEWEWSSIAYMQNLKNYNSDTLYVIAKDLLTQINDTFSANADVQVEYDAKKEEFIYTREHKNGVHLTLANLPKGIRPDSDEYDDAFMSVYSALASLYATLLALKKNIRLDRLQTRRFIRRIKYV